MDAELNLDDELVEHGVNSRMRHRGNRPDRALAVFLKRNMGERGGQLVVFDRKFHRLSEIGAAEKRITIHSVSRKMNGGANTERQLRVALQPGGVTACHNHLIY